MPRPSGHGPDFEQRRQAIIDSAARLFAAQGYAGTGISDLCTEVGLGKGALYYYIGSKEQLLVEIQNRVLAPLLVATKGIEALPTTAMAKLRMVSQHLSSVILERLDHIWVYEHDYRYLTGDNRTRVLEQRRLFERMLRDLIEAAIDDGDLPPADARLATLQFLNLHNHTYQWARANQPWTASDLSATYYRTLMLGFGAAPEAVDRAEQAAVDLLSASA
jgi:AcrR family transcriptional regulator